MNPSRFRPHPAALAVYGALMAGLGLALLLLLLPAGGLRLTAHFILATAMAALIAAVFMNLRAAGPLLRVFALGALLWLLFLFGLTPADYLTR